MQHYDIYSPSLGRKGGEGARALAIGLLRQVLITGNARNV